MYEALILVLPEGLDDFVVSYDDSISGLGDVFMLERACDCLHLDAAKA